MRPMTTVELQEAMKADIKTVRQSLQAMMVSARVKVNQDSKPPSVPLSKRRNNRYMDRVSTRVPDRDARDNVAVPSAVPQPSSTSTLGPTLRRHRERQRLTVKRSGSISSSRSATDGSVSHSDKASTVAPSRAPLSTPQLPEPPVTPTVPNRADSGPDPDSDTTPRPCQLQRSLAQMSSTTPMGSPRPQGYRLQPHKSSTGNLDDFLNNVPTSVVTNVPNSATTNDTTNVPNNALPKPGRRQVSLSPRIHGTMSASSAPATAAAVQSHSQTRATSHIPNSSVQHADSATSTPTTQPRAPGSIDLAIVMDRVDDMTSQINFLTNKLKPAMREAKIQHAKSHNRAMHLMGMPLVHVPSHFGNVPVNFPVGICVVGQR